jgi:LPXTG-motif cell wall-anchored protein
MITVRLHLTFEDRFGGMVHVKISQLMMAAGVAAAALVGFGGTADAAPSASTAAINCVNGDGVLALTVTNSATDVDAQVVVTNPETFVASSMDLAAGASQVVTVDGLSDGSVVVPVQFNGTDQSISAQVACDAPACAEGVLTTVVDDSGVQHEACVASAAAVPPAPAAKAMLAPLTESAPTQPVAAGSASTLPTTGTGTDTLVIAALLVGSGSVASLLGRRKS